MINLSKDIKKLFSLLIIGSLFSVTFAANTSQQGRNILNQLRAEGRTDTEIKNKMEDLGLDTSGYFPNSTQSYSTPTNNYSTSNNTSQQGQNILNQLRAEGRTDTEIKNKMEDLGLDTSGYFPNSSNSTNSNTTQEGRDIINELRDEGWEDSEIKIIMKDLGLDANSYFPNSSSNNGSTNGSTYTSRSCKTYNIKYLDNLGVYISPDMKKTEYFINVDYLKRYIDSKNPQKSGCPSNGGYINTSYSDCSNSPDRYVAPNGKVYYITNQNGLYSSNELSTSIKFSTINGLKSYIYNRNPLAWIGGNTQSTTQTNSQNNNNSNSLTTIWNNVFN